MPFKKGEAPKGSKPFKKGETGNPNGRPKKIPEIDALLADILTEDNEGVEQAKAILNALVTKALKGDTRAAEIILDRAYGKARQSIDLGGNVAFTQHIIKGQKFADKVGE